MRRRWLVTIFIVVLTLPFSAEGQVPFREHDMVVDNIEGPALSVHFIDVGQGDSILLVSPEGENLLIDTGPRKKAANPLPYLKELGIDHIDHLLITHSHLDHTGGFQRLAKVLPIGEFWWSGYFHPTGTGKRFLERIKELKVPSRVLKRGDELKLGKDVKITVLHPPEDMRPVDHDINNYSVVLRVSYGEIDFILTGDAEIKAERMIMASNMNVEAEFLKLGHHGSDTATTLAFLKSVDPEFGVISCGRNNSYGHPHESTIGHLNEAKITILRTDDVGSIVVRTDGKKVSLSLKGRRLTQTISGEPWSTTTYILFSRREDDEALQSLDRVAGRAPARELRIGRAA